ncbi:hypothetical protein [Marinitoga litoralis]|uniref:hypothetical protein n=1 Tax=Marinitoga litoralis TaxID=570855 RepID=UPI00195F7236|nr:hypothetical protein [Marinitoga litoralis]MBM7560202.1 F0F1-type ATP synthase assembly protein I [Marinitoga litoralis]
MTKKSFFITGGFTFIGIGIGFILLKFSALYFIASILIGIGSGLLVGTLTDKNIK